jgi:hypothetical protein
MIREKRLWLLHNVRGLSGHHATDAAARDACGIRFPAQLAPRVGLRSLAVADREAMNINKSVLIAVQCALDQLPVMA